MKYFYIFKITFINMFWLLQVEVNFRQITVFKHWLRCAQQTIALERYCEYGLFCVSRPSVRCQSLWVLTYSTSSISRNARQILLKLCRDDILMVPHKSCWFWALSTQGRIRCGVKNMSLPLRNFFGLDIHDKKRIHKWFKMMLVEVPLVLVPCRS